MSKKKHKQQQVDKVAKETGVDPKELARLDQEALAKIDALTPDEDLLGGGDSPEIPSAPVSIPEETEQGSSVESGSDGSDEVSEVTQEGSSHDVPESSENSVSSEVSDPAPSVSPEVGTVVIAEGPQSGDPAPAETPSELPEVAAGEGQGDSGQDVLPESSAGRVVIGYHPATGEVVHVDEQ